MIKKITKIINEVFEIDLNTLDKKSIINEISNWDSYNHINLIIAIEAGFNIEIQPNEVEKIINIKDLIDIIKLKQK